MDISKQNILFFTRTMGLGGTENVVLQLCEIFKPLASKIVVVSCGGVNTEVLKEMGIRHYDIPDMKNKSPSTLLAIAGQLKKIISDEEITVIHTHHRMAAFYIRALGLYRGRHFFNTSHNTFEDKKWLTRYAFSKCFTVACGSAVRNNLKEYYGLDNVTVIHNAVKSFNEQVIPECEIEKARSVGRFIIGNIGRLSEQKGMEYYIKCIPMVLERFPDAAFYIVGSGEEEEKLRKLSSELNAPVSFLGYRTDVQNLMSQMDLIVLSSLWEGLPLTPIEAFSVGKAVVATDVEGTCEIVKDGENGLIVPKRDPAGLADAIVRLMDDHQELDRLNSNALNTYRNDFSFEAFSDSYIDFYRKH